MIQERNLPGLIEPWISKLWYDVTLSRPPSWRSTRFYVPAISTKSVKYRSVTNPGMMAHEVLTTSSACMISSFGVKTKGNLEERTLWALFRQWLSNSELMLDSTCYLNDTCVVIWYYFLVILSMNKRYKIYTTVLNGIYGINTDSTALLLLPNNFLSFPHHCHQENTLLTIKNWLHSISFIGYIYQSHHADSLWIQRFCNFV